METLRFTYQHQEICYHKIGNGPKAMMALHGFADHGALFKALAPGLAQQFTIFALDLPLHGQSRWAANRFRPEDIRALIQAILNREQIQQFSMMGHSMGGRLILAIAESFDKQLEELVFLAPAGFQNTLSDHKWLFPLWIRKAIKGLSAQRKFVLFVLNLGLRLGIINRGLHLFVKHQIEQEERRQRLFNCWISLYHFPIRLRKFKNWLREKQIPCHFFYGDKDYITPAKYGRKFIQDLPNAELILIDDNHFMLDEPLAKALEKQFTSNSDSFQRL